MPQTQINRRPKETQTEQARSESASLPAAQVSNSDPEIKLEKNGKSIKINLPEGSVTGFTYERQEADYRAKGHISPLENSVKSINMGQVLIEKTNGGLQISIPDNLTLTAITTKADGTLVKTIISNAGIEASQTPPHVSQVQKTPEVSKISEAPKQVKEVDTEPTSKVGVSLPMSKSLDSLKLQAKELNLPESVALKAAEHNLTDLSKVKILGGEYQHCTDQACISLGKVHPSQPQELSKQTTPEPAAVKSTPEKSPVKEVDLGSLAPGSVIHYTYAVSGGTAKGTINVPAEGSQSRSISIPGVGTLTRNTDKSFSFSEARDFKGTISVGETRKEFKAESESSVSTSTAQVPKQKEQEQSRGTQAKALSMSSAEAKKYVSTHKDENIVLIVTAPEVCGPCRNYEPQVHEASAQAENTTFITVDIGRSFSDSNLGVQGVPATIMFRKERTNSNQEAGRISGFMSSRDLLQRIKERLSF